MWIFLLQTHLKLILKVAKTTLYLSYKMKYINRMKTITFYDLTELVIKKRNNIIAKKATVPSTIKKLSK